LKIGVSKLGVRVLVANLDLQQQVI
jgi:hypothetical protein